MHVLFDQMSRALDVHKRWPFLDTSINVFVEEKHFGRIEVWTHVPGAKGRVSYRAGVFEDRFEAFLCALEESATAPQSLSCQ